MPSILSSATAHPLAEWRLRRGLSLGAFGALVGQRAQNVHRYEQGTRMPPEHVRVRIARVTRGAVPADDDFWYRAEIRARKARAAIVAARERVEAEERTRVREERARARAARKARARARAARAARAAAPAPDCVLEEVS